MQPEGRICGPLGSHRAALPWLQEHGTCMLSDELQGVGSRHMYGLAL